MNALVGYTGFVGSNLYAAGHFDAAYNSGNIEKAFGTHPDLLIYAGLRAEKYLANNDPEKDMMQIVQAEENIAKINPKKLVLISTIDVFKVPRDVNENSDIDTKNLHPYGWNRYQLEQWVRMRYPDALIIRLPALFGKNLKKNFIYDLIQIIPFMLKESKMKELQQIDPDLINYYTLLDNGFFKVNVLTRSERKMLQEKFSSIGFSALNFTDSRNMYQFYPLARLWDDIQTALNAGIKLWHPATEPVSAGELYAYLKGEAFVNELDGAPVKYDYKSIYAETFGGTDGYICSKETILAQISAFIKGGTNLES